MALRKILLEIKKTAGKHKLLLLITLLALFLRTYNLMGMPAGLHGDEISIGYSAYSLWKTGKDQNGIRFPVSIDQFGDYRPAGYYYLAIPTVMLFGLTEIAIRLPSSLAGTVLVPLTYALSFSFFGNIPVALVSALFLAISPWHVNLSRATSEGFVAALLIVAGYLLFANAVKTQSRKTLIWAFLSFGASLLFYHAARIFVPLFLPVIAALYFFLYKSKKRMVVPSALGYGAILICVYLLLTSSMGSARPITVNIFATPGTMGSLIHQIAEDGHQNPLITRIFHNKVVHFGRLFLSSYFQHFWGEFLFVTTGKPVRYRIPFTGNMLPADLPFLIFGFAVLLVDGVRKRKPMLLLPIFWILLGALPAGLTWEDLPNAQRSSMMLYGLIPVTAYGVIEFLKAVRAKKNIVAGIIALAYLYSTALFLHNYFHHGRIDETWHRSASVKKLAPAVYAMAPNYRHVIMTTQSNNNLLHFLFYNHIDPAYFHSLGSPREHEGLVFGNIELTGNGCPLGGGANTPVVHEPDVLFVNQYNCEVPKNAKVLESFFNPDNTGAYSILITTPWTEELLREYGKLP